MKLPNAKTCQKEVGYVKETDNSRQKTVDDRTVGNKATKCQSGPNTPVSKQPPQERFPDISEEGKLTKYRLHECAYYRKVCICISGETTARDVEKKGHFAAGASRGQSTRFPRVCAIRTIQLRHNFAGSDLQRCS